MKIIITDGEALNPGDLDWSPLSTFGEIIYYDHTTPAQVAERCKDADIIVANKTIVSKDAIISAANLKLIAVSATGYNNIDTETARGAGALVCNVPEYGTYSVAQHCFALLLELVNHTGANIASVKNDDWAASGKWCYTRQPITELKDKTLGIIGYGRIGKQVAAIAIAFGMNVIFHNRSRAEADHARQVALDELVGESDVISLHCPLTPENKGMVNRNFLGRMKRTALLVNTSRGQLIDEKDLFDALNEERIAGAALDVLTEEPPKAGHPLVHHPKCLVTPHNAWLSVEARRRLMDVTVSNIRNFTRGNPQNVVNR